MATPSHEAKEDGALAGDRARLLPSACSHQMSLRLQERGVVSEEEKARSAEMQSFRFETVHSYVYEQRLRQRPPDADSDEQLARWLLCLLIGLITGWVGFVVNVGTKMLENMKFRWCEALVEAGAFSEPLLLYCAINGAYVLCASALVVLWEPQAKGSGIPEVKSLLNGVFIPRVVGARTLVAKSLGIMFSVAGGLFVGKEGPMVQAGAIVAAAVADGPTPRMTRMLPRWLQGWCTAPKVPLYSTSIHMSVRTSVHMSTHAHVCAHTRTCVCTRLHTSAHTCTRVDNMLP